MNKKKVITTGIWIAIVAAWFGIYKFVQYKIDMYYSNLAPRQFEDDSTYGALKFHSTANTIAFIIFGIVAVMLLYRVLRIWLPKKVEAES